MNGRSGHVVQTSLLMSEASSPRGKQHLRELLEEYDSILSGRIESLKPLSESEGVLRENIEFENQVFKKQHDDAKSLAALAQEKPGKPGNYKLGASFPEEGSDEEEDEDAKKTRREFFTAGQQVRRMFRAVRLHERKKKTLERSCSSDQRRDASSVGGGVERRGSLLSQSTSSSFGHFLDRQGQSEGDLDATSAFGMTTTMSTSSTLRGRGRGGSAGGGRPKGGEGKDQWSDEEVLEHLKEKISQEQILNMELRRKLRSELSGYIDTQSSAVGCSSSQVVDDISNNNGGVISRAQTPPVGAPSPGSSFRVFSAATPSGRKSSGGLTSPTPTGSVETITFPAAGGAAAGGGLEEEGGSHAQQPTSSPPLDTIDKMKLPLLQMVEHWCEWCRQHSATEAQKAERTRQDFRELYGGIHSNNNNGGERGGTTTVSASRYICLKQIAVEQRKAIGLRAAIADCDYELKLHHLSSLLTVPDALVPKVVPPSLRRRSGPEPEPTPYPTSTPTHSPSSPPRQHPWKTTRGGITEKQQRQLVREEQRQSALRMRQQLSATVSDIVHCTNIFTDIVYDEKVVAGLQKEVRRRAELLQQLSKWRHMVDRATAVNVDLQ